MNPSGAYSIDGRTFSFEAPIQAPLPVGAYVDLNLEDGTHFLGQVLEETVEFGDDRRHMVIGHGSVLAANVEGAFRPISGPLAFGDAAISLAEPAAVSDLLTGRRGSGAGLELGHIQQTTTVPAVLSASGFGRHTFLCGQSGSGKTYSLGVVLEQLLLETDIRIVVIDPNSDYVNLASLRTREDTGLTEEEYATTADRYRAIAERIYVFGDATSSRPMRARYGRLSFRQQTMVLGLDPFTHPEEYNAFVRTVRRIGTDDYSVDDLMTAIRASFDDDVRRLGLRIDNLGIADQSIWAGSDETVLDALPEDWRMLIADTGSLDSPEEGSIAAAALLGFLWEQRHNRQPLLIVIDEAHNVCPQDPVDSNQALATEHVVRIAGEGRKYGRYLLLSTQRPSKVHQNVVSQCDNLLLMKVNSATDVATLAEIFSYAPRGLVEMAPGFELGQGLAAGKIAPSPLLFKSGRRLSEEGGTDVSSDWARGH